MNNFAATLLVGAALFAGGCSGDGEPATLVGDVYIALASGEEVNVAENRVHLVTESAELDSALARVCTRLGEETTGLRRDADSATLAQASDRAWSERERILSRYVEKTVVTGDNAQFAIDSVPSGKYRLWSEATVDGNRWAWLHPVRVRPGDSVRVNLSNANTDDNPFRCG